MPNTTRSPAPMRLVREDKPTDPMRFSFTKRMLERLSAVNDKRTWVYDEQAPGLAMQITPTGHKAFYFAKRIDGRYRKIKLADFAEVSVEQARKLALKQAGAVAQGENPAEAKREARAATTLGDLFDYYLERHAKQHKRTWAEDQRQYDDYLKPWAGRRLDQVKRGDVQALHGRIGKAHPVQANRVLALVSKLFNVARDTGYAGTNPAKGIKRYREQSRDRFLDESELPRFIKAVEAEQDQNFRDLFRLLLFTGQRRDNVCSMRWDEIDLKRRVWTIPADKFKAGSAVQVPLAEQVVEIINDRKKPHDKIKWAECDTRAGYIFPSKRRNAKTPYLVEPKGGFARVLEAAEITDLRLHDLRRTTASWATMQGVPYPVVARMVGHKPQGVTAVYARFDLSSVRQGFQATVDAMLATKGGGDGK